MIHLIEGRMHLGQFSNSTGRKVSLFQTHKQKPRRSGVGVSEDMLGFFASYESKPYQAEA